jgi:hypothetical protein
VDVCAAVLMYKTIVNRVHYIWIFMQPDKLVLKVDRLYTLFSLPVFCVVSTHVLKTRFFVWLLYRSLRIRHIFCVATLQEFAY